MKHARHIVYIPLAALLGACGAGDMNMQGGADEAVEAIMSQFYDDIAAYDYAAMRSVYTPEFEILDDGFRFDADGFEELIRDIESRGLTWDFTLSEFNTRIAGDVAYTSYEIASPPDFRWFGGGTLRRSGGGWLVDRMVMMGQSEPTSDADGEDEPDLEITPIQGNLYQFRNGGHNTVFLVTSEGILMTDPISDFTDDAALWLKEQLDQRFGVPVRYVLYSHHHLDHASGGEVFADTATFVGHENMLAKFEPPAADEPLDSFFVGLDADGDDRLSPDESGPLASRFDAWDADADGYLSGAELAVEVVDRVRPPDVVFTDRMEVELGGKTVELVYTGSNHTDDMSVVYFPDERVVFGVDFLGAFNGVPTGPFGGTPLQSWIDSYRVVEALDFDVLAPGHGPMGRKADVTLTRMAFEDLRAAVSAGIEAGQSLDEIQQSADLAGYMHYPTYEEGIGRSIASAYRSIMAQQ